MERHYLFSRWDPLNPSNILAVIMLGWAFSVYHRPFLPEFLPSYQRFDDFMPWAWWGWWSLLNGVLLLVMPRGGGLRVLAHALTGLYLLAAGASFGAGVGITSAVMTYSILAAVSGLLLARAAVAWAQGTGWWGRLVERPPRWLRWLARVESDEGRDG
ncbi:hypothetical protein Dcar01_03521 [Deinococcus carri]|uniref:Uncharacterized protein n=1 Tax=Deinococcus carri TaxID=1211323 RepID=A0ABP9WE67_9DEIO